MAICIRSAQADEMMWVNEQYRAIGFVSTQLHDRQFIAEIDNQRVGLGRLAYVTEGIWELGGIFVLPEFRGQSVARELVRHLLLQAEGFHVYCIPFTNLGEFYRSMGFVECSISDTTPEKIMQKYRWCQQTYSQEVLLLEVTLSAK